MRSCQDKGLKKCHESSNKHNHQALQIEKGKNWIQVCISHTPFHDCYFPLIFIIIIIIIVIIIVIVIFVFQERYLPGIVAITNLYTPVPSFILKGFYFKIINGNYPVIMSFLSFIEMSLLRAWQT